MKYLKRFKTIEEYLSEKSKFYFFAWCTSLETIDLRGLNLKNVTDLKQFAYCCNSLKELYIDTELPNLTDASLMFYNIKTNGTFYYNPKYDYSKIIEVLPSTWKAEAIKN